MKILAAALATCLLAAPVFAQGTTPPAAGADQGKPPAPPESAADAAEPAADPNAAAKPVDPANATPEPTEAPEGTEPVKPADTPSN